MYLFRILAVCIFITSCGGGGGGSPAVPFALTLASNSFSTDEDTSYSGSFAASANETVTLEYLLTETTSNGSLSFSNTANIVYNPNPNFFGQDEFTYSVTAVEKSAGSTTLPPNIFSIDLLNIFSSHGMLKAFKFSGQFFALSMKERM